MPTTFLSSSDTELKLVLVSLGTYPLLLLLLAVAHYFRVLYACIRRRNGAEAYVNWAFEPPCNIAHIRCYYIFG